MRLEYNSRMKMLRGFAVAADLLLLNACLLVPLWLGMRSGGERPANPALTFFNWNCAYLICLAFFPPNLGRRSIQSNEIARSSFRSGLIMVTLHYVIVSLCGLRLPSVWQMLVVSVAVPVWMFISRIFSRAIVRAFASCRQVAYVGMSPTLLDLITTMRSDRTSRYEMAGIFTDSPRSAAETAALRRLGTVSAALDWLATNRCDELYCAVGSVDAAEMKSIFDYCENHLIRFYAVPDSRQMLDLRMTLEMDGDIPLFVPRAEPLLRLSSRFLKRSFDIVFSLLVLAFVFPPVLFVVALKIKASSPGPVFFTQWRDGLDGKRFKCIKFRSMRADGSCDGKAATADDPRKFPFGDWMRRHNVDELPQFVNVLLGDMSVVGPRPHATWTTDAYREIVKRYMVRLYAKPGITGWAQVNGSRGEIKSDDDMQRRIWLDTWYIGHWSFWLDLRIVVMTVANMLLGEKGNAY